jgi:hypothetical protein
MTQDKKSLAEERKGTCFIIGSDLGKRCGPIYFEKKLAILLSFRKKCVNLTPKSNELEIMQ